MPAPHPLPPADLGAHDLPLTRLSGPWLRIHGRYPSPLYFSLALHGRFDDPAKLFGVLYASDALAGSFIEVCGERRRYRAVALKELQNVLVSTLHAKRPLRLVDLRGAGVALLPGLADGGLATLREYPASRAWSAALFAHPCRPDGIVYRARHDLEQVSVALFDRVRDELEATETMFLLNHPELESVLDRYQLGILGGLT